jgi:hypothetical protein
VRLSPLCTLTIIWPIVLAPSNKWWVWSSRRNHNWSGKPMNSEKIYPSATLSTTDPIWSGLGANPGRRSGKPATNRMSYGTATPDMLCRCSKQTVFSLRLRVRRRTSAALLSQSSYAEMANPPLRSSDRDAHTRQEGECISLLQEIRRMECTMSEKSA